MWKKIIWLILIFELIVCWPLSLIKKPAHFDKTTIFYPVEENEKWNFEKKLALDTSRFKKIYYNKTTIFKDRYLKNIGVMIDINNYFFSMHPREDVSGIDYRLKYPFTMILFFILAIKVTIKNKKYFKIWGLILLEILFLSFFKKIDGWDLILYPLITYLLYQGSKELNKYKFSWLINLVLILLTAIEIGRIFL